MEIYCTEPPGMGFLAALRLGSVARARIDAMSDTSVSAFFRFGGPDFKPLLPTMSEWATPFQVVRPWELPPLGIPLYSSPRP